MYLKSFSDNESDITVKDILDMLEDMRESNPKHYQMLRAAAAKKRVSIVDVTWDGLKAGLDKIAEEERKQETQ